MEAARFPWPALGVLLIRDGLVTPAELEEVLAIQGDDRERRISSQRLGEVLVGRGIVTGAQVARLVAEQHELPFIDLDEPDSTVPFAVHLPEELARQHSALPIRVFPDGSLLVVVADPTRPGCFDDIRRALGVPVRFAVAAPDAIGAAIDVASSHALLRENEPDLVEQVDDSPAEATTTRGPPDHLADGSPDDPPSSEPADTAAAASPWPVLGALLLRDSLVTEDELEAALAQQRLSSTRRLGEILVSRGALTNADVSRLLAEQHELPFVELSDYDIDLTAASKLSADLAHIHAALPISVGPDGSLLVAVADPLSAIYADQLRAALGVPLRFAVAVYGDICDAINNVAEELRRPRPEAVPGPEDIVEPEVVELEDVAPATAEHSEPEHSEPDDDAEPAPEAEPSVTYEVDGDDEHRDTVRPTVLFPRPEALVMLEDDDEAFAPQAPAESSPTATETIEGALALGASAVHFTATRDGFRVDARIDGLVSEVETISSPRAGSLQTELAGLADRGHTTFVVGDRSVELRASWLPTLGGMRVTFRAMPEERGGESLSELLDATGDTDELRFALERRAGLVLFCGPASSGRTTTLYSALRELEGTSRALLTIEDPVHRALPGACQAEVDRLRSLTLAAGLHAILRSDPDVAVVSDLDDEETARLAARGARDVLVLSTVSAETASAGARRLLDLGVDPGPLSEALAGVVAQRLVRSACLECREPYYASLDELSELGLSPEESGRRLLGRSHGCPSCDDTGYDGRVAIFEVLPLTRDVRELLACGAAASEIERAAVAAGMTTLRESAIRLCLDGRTTSAEVLRLSRARGRID